MKNDNVLWFALILLGAAFALPPALFAAEKADVMKDDMGKMMKDDMKMASKTKKMMDEKKN